MSYFRHPRRENQFRLNNSGNIASSSVSGECIRILGNTDTAVYFYFTQLPKAKKLEQLVTKYHLQNDGRTYQVKKELFENFSQEL